MLKKLATSVLFRWAVAIMATAHTSQGPTWCRPLKFYNQLTGKRVRLCQQGKGYMSRPFQIEPYGVEKSESDRSEVRTTPRKIFWESLWRHTQCALLSLLGRWWRSCRSPETFRADSLQRWSLFTRSPSDYWCL